MGVATPGRDSLTEAFQQAIEEAKPVYLVLDALDECITRSTLLKGLEEMHHWDLPNLHILVTSRK